MSDLIDRQAAIKAICDECIEIKDECDFYSCELIAKIAKLPSAIVHCKDCKHWVKTSAQCRYWSKLGTVYSSHGGYCYKGESE